MLASIGAVRNAFEDMHALRFDARDFARTAFPGCCSLPELACTTDGKLKLPASNSELPSNSRRDIEDRTVHRAALGVTKSNPGSAATADNARSSDRRWWHCSGRSHDRPLDRS